MTHATLRVLQKQANVRTVRLHPETVVGRSLDCTLKIASTQVSRRHCRIVDRDDGVFIEDLGSANGTFLDGSRLTPNVPTLARPGSQLAIGPATFVVEYEGTTLELGALPVAAASAALPAAPESTNTEAEQQDLGDVSPEETGAFSVQAIEESLPEFDFAVAEASPAPPPIEEPQPKRMRSLFGLFGRSKQPDEPPAAVPFLPASEPAPLINSGDEIPVSESTAESVELTAEPTLDMGVPVDSTAKDEEYVPEAETGESAFDFIDAEVADESAGGDDDLQNFLQQF